MYYNRLLRHDKLILYVAAMPFIEFVVTWQSNRMESIVPLTMFFTLVFMGAVYFGIRRSQNNTSLTAGIVDVCVVITIFFSLLLSFINFSELYRELMPFLTWRAGPVFLLSQFVAVIMFLYLWGKGSRA